MKTLNTVLSLAVISTVVFASNTQAGERWFVSASANTTAAKYADSLLRDKSITGGVRLDIEYLDYYSITAAYSNHTIDFKDTGAGEFAINQQTISGRFQYHSYNDTLGGRITTQLVVHRLSNDAPTTITDDTFILAPKLAYLSYGKSLYFDIEYIYSDYADKNNLILQQLSPSFGFGFNNNNDWLQLTGYQITSSDKSRSQGEDSLTAASIKWLHWFNPGPLLGLHSFSVDVLTGQRIFAVDNDSFTVYNLEDIQQESVRIGFGWRPGEDFNIDLIASLENYENKLLNNTYKREYVYLSLSKHW